MIIFVKLMGNICKTGVSKHMFQNSTFSGYVEFTWKLNPKEFADNQYFKLHLNLKTFHL